MEIIISSLLGGIAILSVWATYYLNRRARLQGELPKLALYCDQPALQHICYLRLKDNYDWNIVEVKVDRPVGIKCLKISEHSWLKAPTLWSDSISFEPGVSLARFIVNSNHLEVYLSVICRTHLWKWWKWWEKKRLTARYVRGELPFFDPDAADFHTLL